MGLPCVQCGLQANLKWLQATAWLQQCAPHALSKAQRSAKLALLPSRKSLWILGMLPCPVLLLRPCSRPVAKRHLPLGQHWRGHHPVVPPSLPPLPRRWQAAHVLPEHCCRQIRLGPLARPCAAIQHAKTGLQLQQVHHGIPGPLIPPASLGHPQGPSIQDMLYGPQTCPSPSAMQQAGKLAGAAVGTACEQSPQRKAAMRPTRASMVPAEHGGHWEPWGASLTSGRRGGSWGPAGRGGSRARAASCSAWWPSPPWW